MTFSLTSVVIIGFCCFCAKSLVAPTPTLDAYAKKAWGWLFAIPGKIIGYFSSASNVPPTTPPAA